jgi:phospholipid-translocating ATPase
MVLAAVLATNLFNGLNTNVWTGWVFFAVFVGVVLVWLYTVSRLPPCLLFVVLNLFLQALYSLISPGWFHTPVYGNDHYLFCSAYFWLCLPLTVCLSLAPRFIAKALKFGFAPDDIDIMRWISKFEPTRDIAHDAQLGGGLKALKRPPSVVSHTTSRTDSITSIEPRRPSVDPLSASRTDMSTGIRSVHRGFNFSTEENGVAMRRMQSNLSERRQNSRHLTPPPEAKSGLSHVFSLRRGLLKRKPSPKNGE